MDLMGKEVLARKFRPRDWDQRDEVILLQQRRLSDGWSWTDSTWTVIDGADRREYTISHRLYSAAELRREMLEAGFARAEVYGDLAGSDYDHEARRLVAMAVR